MNRTANLIYASLFCLLLVALSLWSLRGAFSYAAPEKITVLNGKLTHSFEKYYDEQFPIKQVSTNLWALADYVLFGEGRQGLVIGENGWLFSDEEFDPVADGQNQVRDNLALIRGVRDELARHDVKLMLAIVPAKTRLYPEYLGDSQPNALHRDLYAQFRGAAQQADILAPDLLAPLEQAKGNGQVFLRTDTHWTPFGAEVVAAHLGAAARQAIPLAGDEQNYVTEVVADEPYKGDLTRFLPLDPLFAELMPTPDTLQRRETRSASEENADALFAESELPVTLVGTSYSANPNWNFAGALRQSLKRDLANHAEEGQGPLVPMLKYLQSDELKNNPPQLVIWEFPERYLPMAGDLKDFDPNWLAALKADGEHQKLAANSR